MVRLPRNAPAHLLLARNSWVNWVIRRLQFKNKFCLSTATSIIMLSDEVTCSENGEDIFNDGNVPNVIEIDKNYETLKDDTLLGQIVSNETEAYELYCDYGFCKGFNIRKGKQAYYAGTKKIRTKEYYCSKHGYKNDEVSGEVSFNRLDGRTGCKAMIRFVVDEQEQWKVICFVDEHNHSFATPEERHLLRSVRTVTGSKGKVLKSMMNVGIRAIDAFSYMAEESGGPENLGFTKKDCYNFVNAERLKLIEVGDSQSLVNLFKTRSHEEGGMYYWDVQLDTNGRMTYFFWRDGRSKIDYDCFGDVVIFDTTYRTNRYNLICAPFVGVNHHWQNIMFGCAFLSDETTKSFEWLFSTFLESMGGQQPKTIITDQDKAMGNAIASIFPDSRHRLCMWHICKNATSYLGSLNSNKVFQNLFHKYMHECDSEVEFEEVWAKMVSDYTNGEHSWLNNLYKIRKKWSTALNKDVFDGGIKASQRSESTNNVLNRMTKKTTSLTEFVVEFQKLVIRWRKNEAVEDYNCHQKIPTCVVKHSKLLKHAAEVYTHKIYKLFEKEYLDGCGSSNFEKFTCGGDLFRFDLMMQGRESKIIQVQLDVSTMEVQCSCNKFNTLGILCAHALVVLNLKNVSKIPDRYILTRWSKDAKKRIHTFNQNVTSLGVSSEPNSSYRSRTMQYAYDLIIMSQGHQEGRQIFWQHLDNAYNALREFSKNSSTCEGGSGRNDNDTINKDVMEENNDYILDPPQIKPKGVSNSRLKGHLENTQRRKSNGKRKETAKRQKQQLSSQITSQTPAHISNSSGVFANSGLECRPSFHPIYTSSAPFQISTSTSYCNIDFSNVPFTAMLQDFDMMKDQHEGSNNSRHQP
ncbi:protein FAR1-RELATED SEQUENCE 5-like [Mercurialis annua]|uniref:protein FAR1-RELATED SEQUENCE 5-like n=1 Tax=Mercurialis annua TaxID=3986 RepID=UPI0024AD17AC|nr:protein FAR1-RELATED SEQUENCE 5-like [Mercurialis annua]